MPVLIRYRSCRSFHRGKALLQIRNDIIDMFRADGKADAPVFRRRIAHAADAPKHAAIATGREKRFGHRGQKGGCRESAAALQSSKLLYSANSGVER